MFEIIAALIGVAGAIAIALISRTRQPGKQAGDGATKSEDQSGIVTPVRDIKTIRQYDPKIQEIERKQPRSRLHASLGCLGALGEIIGLLVGLIFLICLIGWAIYKLIASLW